MEFACREIWRAVWCARGACRRITFSTPPRCAGIPRARLRPRKMRASRGSRAFPPADSRGISGRRAGTGRAGCPMRDGWAATRGWSTFSRRLAGEEAERCAAEKSDAEQGRTEREVVRAFLFRVLVRCDPHGGSSTSETVRSAVLCAKNFVRGVQRGRCAVCGAHVDATGRAGTAHRKV